MQTPSVSQDLELIDIYGLWHVPFWQRVWFIYLIVLLGLLIVCFLILFIIYNVRKRKPAIPAWQRALKALQQMKDQNMFNVGQSDPFYVQLTAILKHYLSLHYATDIQSKTDDEMVTYIESLVLPDQMKDELKRMFLRGQLIKFSNQDAIIDQMKTDWQVAYKFIHYHKTQEEDHSS